MSEVAIGGHAASSQTFNRRTALLLVVVGVAAFIAMLVLGAYAPDLRSGRNGGAHALSNAATGFSGLVRLAESTGRNPQVLRSPELLDSEDLLVVTPENGRVELSDILEKRGSRVTLIVLPKWDTQADDRESGWVRIQGPRSVDDTARTLHPMHPFSVRLGRPPNNVLQTVSPAAPAGMRFRTPRPLQSISGKGWTPLITNGPERIILAQWEDEPLFVLADPDLLNNHGMKDPANARAALALVDFLNRTGAESVLFDVTINGLGVARSPLRLAFEPPFLAVTLSIAAALLLAGLQALTRFGSPRRAERAIGFGKAALVDNAAALVRRAGREARFGARYADVVRSRAVALLRLPATLNPEEVDARLDQASTSGSSFSALVAASAQVRTRDQLTDVAKRLHRWLKEFQA